MKTFLVEFRLQPGAKKKALDLFELQGPNRSPGVLFRNGWIATKEDALFVLCESDDESLVTNACCGWGEFGESRVHCVLPVDKY